MMADLITIQGCILGAMEDLVRHADDTIWLMPNETVFERLVDIYKVAGGPEDALAEMFPEYFDNAPEGEKE